jgi:hypothetical protein
VKGKGTVVGEKAGGKEGGSEEVEEVKVDATHHIF